MVGARVAEDAPVQWALRRPEAGTAPSTGIRPARPLVHAFGLGNIERQAGVNRDESRDAMATSIGRAIVVGKAGRLGAYQKAVLVTPAYASRAAIGIDVAKLFADVAEAPGATR